MPASTRHMHLQGAQPPTTLKDQMLAGKASAPLLPQLAQSLPDWFEGTRHSSFLYVASELIKVFGSDVSQRQQLGGDPVHLSPAGFHTPCQHHAMDVIPVGLHMFAERRCYYSCRRHAVRC